VNAPETTPTDRRVTPSSASRRWTFAALMLVVAVGIGARCWGIDTKPVWHDEVYTRIFAAGHQSSEWIAALYTGRPVSRDEILAFQRLDPDRDAVDTARGLARDEPQHPPAYYVLARLWMGAFGDDIGALRALSVVLSLLALWAAAWLGRELFGPRGPPAAEAVVAERARSLLIALLAASPFVVLYAQEAREYSLWSVWILAGTAALLRALRVSTAAATRAARVRAWATYAVVTALGLYTSFSHVAVIAAHVLYVALRTRGRVTREGLSAALALLGSAALFTPWAVLLAEHMEAFQASMAWSRTIIVPRGEVLATLASNVSRPILDLWPVIAGSVAWGAVALTCAGVVAALARLGRRGPRQTRALVILLVVVPIGVLVVPDLAVGGVRSFSTRYLFPALLAVLVAVAWALASVPRRGVRRALVALVLGVMVASAVRTTGDAVPWTRALSAGVPHVAAAVNASAQPLVVGDRERHHPGNLLALATMVGPDATFVLLDHPDRASVIDQALAEAEAGGGAWPPGSLPAGHTVFVYAPIPQLREALEGATGRPATLVWRDLYVSCWRL
jgi:uncharacterized membrane protein